MTTKTHGNLLEASLFGEVDGAGRLLMNDMCFATVEMAKDTQTNTYANYLAGESVRYTTKVNDVVTNGVVKFIDAPEPIEIFGATMDVESLAFEFNWLGFGDYMETNVVNNNEFGTKLNETGIDPETIVLYNSVVCGECEATGVHEDFFMWCGGTIDQALFDTGNCCLVNYDQLDGQQDVRRLGKCTSAKRRRGGF